VLATLTLDDGCTGVLAHREHAARGDVGVLEQVQGDELVVVAGLGVVEDLGDLGQVVTTEVVGDVVHRRLGEQTDGLGVHPQEGHPVGALDRRHTLGGEEAVLGGVLPDGKKVLVEEVGHQGLLVLEVDKLPPG